MATFTYTAKKDRGALFTGEAIGDSKAAVCVDHEAQATTHLRSQTSTVGFEESLRVEKRDSDRMESESGFCGMAKARDHDVLAVFTGCSTSACGRHHPGDQLRPKASFGHQRRASRLRLRAGQTAAATLPVKLVLEDGREYAHPGKLLFQDLAVDPATGSVGLRAEFPNPQRVLLPGQFVSVRLPVAQSAEQITVPQRAVQASAQGQLVMIVTPDGKLAPQPVKTAGLAGSDWVVSEGLKGGEQVVVNGLQKARPGMPVKAVPQGGATVPAPTPAPSPSGTPAVSKAVTPVPAGK